MAFNQFFVLFVIVGSTIATEVNECKSGLPQPLTVDVKDCAKGPCDFPRGSTVFLNITFDAPNDLEHFEPKIVATALGVDVDYPLTEPNGCNELINDSCPLEEGQRVLYATTMDILPYYPTIPVGIELTLYGPNEDGVSTPFSCFQINCQVTN